MAIPFASTAPVRLDELLQVPLKLVPLEDLIRERVSKISGGNLQSGQIHPDKSHSSPCLFDCCTTPSRWKKTGPFSNLAKFTSQMCTLSDGTLAVLPLMDLSQGTLADGELTGTGSDNAEEIPANDINPRADAAHVTERNGAIPTVVSNPNVERANHVMSGGRSGESGRSSSSSISSSSTAPVVLGKVTENPTRYEDLLTGQGESEKSNNNNSESSDRNVISVGGSNTPPPPPPAVQDQGTNSNKLLEPVSADNTLKLTYFNDGRKQSEKAFRTSEIVEVAVLNDGDGQVSTSTHDSHYFENQHGLQLSRIRRDVDIDQQGDNNDNPPPPQRHTNANDENTQDKSRQVISLNNINKSSENAWEQYNVLQISRCQKDAPEKVQNLEEGEAIPANSSTVQEKNNPQTQKPNKGEGETSVEAHMKSILTTYKYLRPGAQMGGSASSFRRSLDYSSPTAGASITASDSAKPNSTTGKALLHAEVDRGGGVVRVSPAVRSSPGRPRGSSISKVVTHPSPPIYHHQHSQQSHHHRQAQLGSAEPSTTSSSWAAERAIARIPTRPYLLKNITYELPPNQQRSNPPNNQQSHGHGLFSPAGPTPLTSSASSLHSNPKRFKPANLPVNPPSMARQPNQLHALLPNVNRYPSLNHTGGVPSGNGGVYTPHNPIPYTPHQISSLSSSSNRSSIMAYHGNCGDVQNNQQHSASLYGNNRSPSHGLTNIPYRSPQGSSEPTRSVRNVESYTNSHYPLPESLMIAAAVAANSAEPSDHSNYYERIREYYEYYQNQQLEWSKLAEYHQKSQLYSSWDAPSAYSQNAQIIRQGRTQHQPQRSPDGGRGHGLNAANMTQHQLALRAMDVAGTHRSSMIAGQVSKGIEPYQIHNSPGSHGRGSKIMMNLSPPQTSPSSSSLQTIQGKYAHTPHQLQQLRQLQERQYQNQIHQQEQLRYLASHQQSRSHSHGYPSHYPQQRQDQQQSPGNKVQQGASSIPSNYEIQNSPQYRAAYDQLAAAASAISNNNKRPSVIDIVQNHLRTSLNNLNGGNANTITPSNQQNAGRHHRHNPKTNYQQSSGPSASTSMTPILMSSPTTPRISQSATPPTPLKEAPFMPNIHRQTLEHAIKNNFNSHSNDMTIHRDNNSGGTIVQNPRYINITPSPPPLPLSPPPTQNSREWQNSAIEGSSHHANMTKEPLQTASSPTLAHQALVIRRAQQAEQLSPVSSPSTVRNSPMVAQAPMIISNIPGSDIRISPQHHVANPRINYTNNLNLGHHEGVLKRRINIVSNRSPPPPSPDSDHHHHNHHNEIHRPHNSRQRTPSPIPLIVGQEEIVTTSVSPSSIPTAISPVVRDGEILEREEDGEENINRGSNSSPGDGANWQYDHVVLLDNYIGEMLAEEVDHSRQSAEGSEKRTKTYMCKRCFETLKTEQEIRNHLFCKMLAGHVRCHVCFQLLKSDNYPEHLQVHGVRPPEED